MTDQAENVTPLPAPRPQLSTGGTVAPIVPQDVEGLFRLATIVAKAGMAPAAYKSNPEAIMVAMMHGMEIGLTPMVALQSIAVINGTPSLWGDGLLGVVRGSGLLEDFEETFSHDSEGNALAATCRAKRKGQASPIERTFTRAQAAKAGLASKKGPWSEYPERMLQMRARSWALRDGFADVLKGLAGAEEVRDGGHLVEQDDGSYAPPPRPQRQDFETTPAPIDEALDGDAIEAPEQAETEAEADPTTAWAFVDLAGEERVFDTSDEAAGAFEHAINETDTFEQAENLWNSNETFRDALKAADKTRHLNLRQFYSDVSGVVPTS